MTIAYPRNFPTVPGNAPNIFASGNFWLGRLDAVNQKAIGFDVMEIADPGWTASYETPPLRASQRAIWQAWALSLRGGLKSFWGYHPLRQFPLAYGASVLTLTRFGGGTFDGTATLQARVDASTVQLGGLPALYRVTVGDMVSLVRGASRSLHMAVESVTGTSGGFATFAVEPHIPADVQIGNAAVQLVRATCRMLLKHETFKSPEGTGLIGTTFDAVQDTSAA